MCGIVGLFLKDAKLQGQLGRLFAPMLVGMSARGPDSAGIAIYRNPAPAGAVKLTLYHGWEGFAWADLADALAAQLDAEAAGEVRASHFVLTTTAAAADVSDWLSAQHPDVRIMGVGDSIEIYKEKGRPGDVVARFRLDEMAGSHAVGHTRMATESAVTTAHSHPFSTGLDLCLVHNGSLSNHNSLRRRLARQGIAFQTDNDTEVAAGYFAHRMSQGATLEQALEAGLADLDGFYTFAIGTKDGFAVLRDGFACKPAVLAETDGWVAMASEFRSIAHLPDAAAATIWEPAPATIYAWARD